MTGPDLTRALAALRPGDPLQLRVIQRVDAHNARVAVNDQVLTARTTAPLSQADTTLTARLVTAVRPPHAPGADGPRPTPTLTLKADSPVAAALRRVLPAQLPLDELLSKAPAALAEGNLRSVLSVKPQTLMHGPGLARALQNSGLFFESRLARADARDVPGLLKADWKGALLKLLATLPKSNSSVEGREAAERAQLRIELNQLLSLERGIWHLELPLDRGEKVSPLHLEVERESRADQSPTPEQWLVRFGLEVDRGVVEARIAYQGGEVAVGLTTPDSQTQARLHAHQRELEESLAAAGLTVQGVSCRVCELETRPPMLARSLLEIEV